MKKILSIILAIVLVCSLSACSLTDMFKGMSSLTYNDSLPDGYMLIEDVDGVKFAIPTEYTETELGTTEFEEALETTNNKENLKKITDTFKLSLS